MRRSPNIRLIEENRGGDIIENGGRILARHE
ncbi:MAG: hypothetical protein QOI22_1448, partial [Verrucomicrobiota bacterium]